jgi:LysM repeat protein
MTRANVGAAVTIAAAALVLGAVFGQPGNGRAAGTGPVSTGTPTLSGAAQEGQTLTVSNGSWSGSPTSYAYAWSKCDANGGSCSAIPGATASTYKAATTDVGQTLRVTVTATNAGGSGQAASAPSAVVSSAAAPTNTTAPAISGSLQVGSTLTASTGAWSGNPTSYAFVWSRCDAHGDSCAAIDGATGKTYTLTQAAAGRTLRISVVATKGGGAKPLSTQVTPAPTASVPASNGCPTGTGTIQVSDLRLPARLSIDAAAITPKLVTLGTHTIQLHIRVTACGGRPVQGATVFATPIPYNQFQGPDSTTGPSGTATVTEKRRRGFPARRRNQHLLAVFVRATKPGDPVLGGVSTRRTVAFRVNLP